MLEGMAVSLGIFGRRGQEVGTVPSSVECSFFHPLVKVPDIGWKD